MYLFDPKQESWWVELSTEPFPITRTPATLKTIDTNKEFIVNELGEWRFNGIHAGTPDYIYKMFESIRADSGGGVTIHDDLSGKNAQNQHPISSITGLDSVLETLQENIITAVEGAVGTANAYTDTAISSATADVLRITDISTAINNSSENTTVAGSKAVYDLVQEVAATIPAGGLKVPVEVDLESGLATAFPTPTAGDYAFIQNMDVSAPQHTGRAWYNNGGWYKVFDQYQSPDGETIGLNGIGALWVKDYVVTAITEDTTKFAKGNSTLFGFRQAVYNKINGIIALMVPSTRTITPTAPLTGGGTLDADLILDVDAATDTTAGVSRYATVQEVKDGANTTAYITPSTAPNLSTTLTDSAGTATLPTTGRDTIISKIQTLRNNVKLIFNALWAGTSGQFLISNGLGAQPTWTNIPNWGTAFAMTSSNEVVIARQSVYNTQGFYDLGDIGNTFWYGGTEYNVTIHYNNSVSNTLAGDGVQAVYGCTPYLPSGMTVILGVRWRGATDYRQGHHYDLTLRSSSNKTIYVPNRAFGGYYGHEGGSTSSAKYGCISYPPFMNDARYTAKVYTPSNINDI